MTSPDDTSPGGGRPITLESVLNKLVELHEDHRLLREEVKTAIRPLRFPMAPLWVMAISVALIALVGCYAAFTPRVVIQESTQPNAAAPR